MHVAATAYASSIGGGMNFAKAKSNESTQYTEISIEMNNGTHFVNECRNEAVSDTTSQHVGRDGFAFASSS